MISTEVYTFIKVCELGSFTKASKELYLTPAGVKKQIDYLEDYYGAELLIRTNHGISLTDYGKLVLEECKKLLELDTEIKEKIKEIKDLKDHTLKIGSSSLNPYRPFIEAYHELGYDYGYKIQIIPFNDNHFQIYDVLDHLGKEIDIIVGACDSSKWLDHCSFLLLGYYTFTIAVPLNHPLAYRKQLSLEDLHGYSLLMMEQGTSKQNNLLRQEIEEKHPTIILKATDDNYDLETFNKAEKENDLLLSLSCWDHVHPMFNNIPLLVDYKIPYGLLYAKKPNKAIFDFIRLIERCHIVK